MKVLLIGSGGRESAMAWKIAQSTLLTQLYVAPGNPFTAGFAKNCTIAVEDFKQIGDLVRKEQISLVVVGPEVPLVKGIRDYFYSQAELRHVLMIGPDAKGAQLEGSKDFSKVFMKKYNIPTASYATFDKDTLEKGLSYLEKIEPPYVLKADGLAAGKGVIITSDLQEAKQTLTDMIDHLKFGASSAKVVIEAFLSGIELSVFALTDGHNYLLLPEAKDYKRIGEGDTGPNTGGMGAISPVPFADKAFMEKVKSRIVEPTILGLKHEQINYIGFIFFGLINVDGNPFVIEYNCRLGDPETEVVFPRITSDVLEILYKAAQRRLHEVQIQIDERACTTIMAVAGGYPESYEKGNVIHLPEVDQDTLIFHAGTNVDKDGQLVTHGGRVLAFTAFGKNLSDALKKSVSAAEKTSWSGKYFRKDIGYEFL